EIGTSNDHAALGVERESIGDAVIDHEHRLGAAGIGQRDADNAAMARIGDVGAVVLLPEPDAGGITVAGHDHLSFPGPDVAAPDAAVVALRLAGGIGDIKETVGAETQIVWRNHAGAEQRHLARRIDALHAGRAPDLVFRRTGAAVLRNINRAAGALG